MSHLTSLLELVVDALAGEVVGAGVGVVVAATVASLQKKCEAIHKRYGEPSNMPILAL